MDDQDFLTLADELLETIEELSDDTYTKASNFFDSVKEKVDSMAKRVRDGAPVSQAMGIALENMQAGVSRWIDD